MQWYRAWHGTVNDSKWNYVARKASATVGQVYSVWMAALEYASQNNPRGSLAGFHHGILDATFGYEDGTTGRIVAGFAELGLIDPDSRVAKWEERQPRRDLPSAERAGSVPNRHALGTQPARTRHAPGTTGHQTGTNPSVDSLDIQSAENQKEEPPAVAGGAGGNDTDIRRLADYVDQVTGGAWGYQARNQYLAKTWPVDSWLEAWRRVAAMPKLPGKPWPYVVSIINGWEGGIPPAPTPTLKLAEPRPTLGQRLDEKQARMAEAFANWGKEAASA